MKTKKFKCWSGVIKDNGDIVNRVVLTILAKNADEACQIAGELDSSGLLNFDTALDVSLGKGKFMRFEGPFCNVFK